MRQQIRQQIHQQIRQQTRQQTHQQACRSSTDPDAKPVFRSSATAGRSVFRSIKACRWGCQGGHGPCWGFTRRRMRIVPCARGVLGKGQVNTYGRSNNWERVRGNSEEHEQLGNEGGELLVPRLEVEAEKWRKEKRCRRPCRSGRADGRAGRMRLEVRARSW